MNKWPGRIGRSARVVALGLSVGMVVVGPLMADPNITSRHDPYVPTIWVDPDGCQHWAMDDGYHGYMDIRLTRDGKPVCGVKMPCADVPADKFFATGSAAIPATLRRELERFFKDSRVSSFAVEGHTDSVGGAAANRSLSLARARAVASVAASVGATVTEVRGSGEARPVASNATAAGRAENRRVEIYCAP